MRIRFRLWNGYMSQGVLLQYLPLLDFFVFFSYQLKYLRDVCYVCFQIQTTSQSILLIRRQCWGSGGGGSSKQRKFCFWNKINKTVNRVLRINETHKLFRTRVLNILFNTHDAFQHRLRTINIRTAKGQRFFHYFFFLFYFGAL